MDLLVATQNDGKAREYRDLLAPLEATLRFPGELGLHLDVVEDGTTYAENAYKKAAAYAEAAGMLALADDSGLEVDALDGAPGIHSARYAEGSDADRVAALLAALLGVPWEQRTARFRCVIAIVTPTGVAYEAEGVCEGVITFEPSGAGGFGYDPIFYVPEQERTMAQLSRAEKNRLSHRARAAAAALPILQDLKSAGD
jgi:XTP/dITP diphosphohydrolase